MALDVKKSKEETFQEIKDGLISRFGVSNNSEIGKVKQNAVRRSFNGPLKEFAWNGSLNSIISTDNITDDLLKESVQELQKALQESQSLLEQRDIQIGTLRKELDSSKRPESVDISRQGDLLKDLETSQRRVLELETDLASLRKEVELQKQEQLRQLPPRLFQSDEEGQTDETMASKYSTCTCYCGSMCRALKEASEAKQKLDCIEKKYVSLKQRIRERRKAAESMSRGPIRVTVTEKTPGCTIQ